MFAEAEAAIRECEAHLKSTESFNTVVEGFLVQYLLILICRECEVAVRQIISDRAVRTGDAEVSEFVRSAVEQLIRSIRIGEISGALGRFGQSQKMQFQEFVSENPVLQTSHDTVINNRHLVAHREGVQITFNELKGHFSQGRRIIEQVGVILGEGSKA
jgi:hypothetical protein